MRGTTLFGIGVLVCVLSSATYGVTYTGSLSYVLPADGSDGLTVQGGGSKTYGDYKGWTGEDITFTWAVRNDDPCAPSTHRWEYVYHVQIAKHLNGDLKYPLTAMAIEVPEEQTNPFTLGDLAGVSGSSIYALGWVTAVGMPEPMHGILFHRTGTSHYDWTVSFFSDREPVWGDAYFQNGAQNVAWNKGFTANDVDPDPLAYPPSDGSLNFHVLVPDPEPNPGNGGDLIPEPVTMASVFLGIGGLGAYLRRRREV